MKRSKELRDLSEQHHHGLVAARRLRRAAERKEPLAEMIKQFLGAWHAEIQPHFRLEEEVLLPEFARAVAPDHALIVQTLTEHVALRRGVRELQDAEGERQRTLAQELGEALNEHIRFEERILFPAIEAAIEGPRRAALAEELTQGAAGKP